MTFSRIWHEHYNPTVPTEITVPDTDITAALDDTISRFGSRTALNFLGAPITYADLGTQISLAAGMLRDLGVQPGDRVAIALPNCTSHVIAFYAVLRLGAIVVEHNPLYTQQELVHQLNDSGATVAIFWERTAAILGQASTSTSVSTLITVDVARDLPLTKRLLLNLPVKKPATPKPNSKPPRPHTRNAGNNSSHRQPRYPPTTHVLPPVTWLPCNTPVAQPAPQRCHAHPRQPRRQLHPRSSMDRSRRQPRHRNRLRNPAVLPRFGLTLCLTYALRIGATVMLFPKFEVNSFLDAQKKHPGTFLPAVPPMLGRIVTAARERNVDLTSFRYAICGAMPLDAQTAAAWEDATGGLAIEGYGMTETSPVALGNPLSDQRKPGHLGLPFPSTDVLIVDQEDGRTPVQLGERGELLISGPQVFSGYWGKPQETEQVLVDIDGRTWIRTGDVVVMDETGSVKVVDRIKEMIITGGFKVFPSQVEECVRQMPEVEDVAVVGVPGGDMGEKVVAAVVLAQGATELDVKAVQGWCEKQLARYALPREVIVVPELPRSQIGKVLRRVVRDNVMGGSAAAG